MFRGLVFVIFLGVLAPPVAAQDQTTFDVRFRGIPVAQIVMATRATEAQYALAGQVRATGLAGLFASVRFDMAAEGRLTRTDPAPDRYEDDVDTGRRQSQVEMAWQRGVPVILGQTPEVGPDAIPPDAARGTIDPLSALWQVMRDRDRGALCNRVMQVYDGARRSQLSLGPVRGSGDTLTCDGEYRRIGGFPAEAMAERQRFPFTVHYARHDGVWRLTLVDASSLFGPIRILRRD